MTARFPLWWADAVTLPSPVRILVVEDDPVARSILARLLKNHGHEVHACADAEHAETTCRAHGGEFPLVILDLFLPGRSGFDFCRWLREEPGGDRHYILAGTASKEPADLRRVLDAGADDYLIKPYRPELLYVRLVVAEQNLRVRAARRELEEQLRHERERLAYLATRDPLTKLFNRAQLASAIDEVVTKVAGGGSPGALIYIDLDNFKIVNDTLGHAAGDRLLVQLAYLLQGTTRQGDVAARFGGDEFVILLKDISAAEATTLAERFRARVGEFVFCDSGKSFHVGVSIGLTLINGQAPGEQVVAYADAACYAAKSRGRNRVELYQANGRELAQLRRDSDWMAQVKEALKSNRFEIWFQPIVELDTGRPHAYEALLRLCTETGEYAPPSVFLPAAERFRLMGEIDRWVIRAAARHLAADDDLKLCVNLSGQSFGDDSLPGFIEKRFAAAGVAPERVTFEITESAVISNLATAQTMIGRLRVNGFRFALDDFGAGFSSFAYLKHLHVDYLKIDGSFIRDLIRDPANLPIVKVMHDIAHHLGIRSVAEFVEGAEEVAALRGIGVDLAQGYFFGKPEPRQVVETMTFR